MPDIDLLRNAVICVFQFNLSGLVHLVAEKSVIQICVRAYLAALDIAQDGFPLLEVLRSLAAAEYVRHLVSLPSRNDTCAGVHCAKLFT